jgi:hypothetical protein
MGENVAKNPPDINIMSKSEMTDPISVPMVIEDRSSPGLEDLVFDKASLSIESSFSRLDLSRLRNVSRLSAKAVPPSILGVANQDGIPPSMSIALHGVTFEPWAEVSLISSIGDVFIDTDQTLDVHYSHPEGVYCLTAANVTKISEECIETSSLHSNATCCANATCSYYYAAADYTESNSSMLTSGEWRACNETVDAWNSSAASTTYSCSGQSILCTELDCSDYHSTETTTKIVTSTTDGGIYVLVRDIDSLESVNSTNSSVADDDLILYSATNNGTNGTSDADSKSLFESMQGPGFEGAQGFSEVGAYALKAVKDFIGNLMGTDYLIYIDLEMPDQSVWSWVYVNKVQYLQLTVNHLSALSATLLKPATNYAKARVIAPGCPFFPTHPVNNIHDNEAVQMFGYTATFLQDFFGSTHKPIKSFHSITFVLLGSSEVSNKDKMCHSPR